MNWLSRLQAAVSASPFSRRTAGGRRPVLLLVAVRSPNMADGRIPTRCRHLELRQPGQARQARTDICRVSTAGGCPDGGSSGRLTLRGAAIGSPHFHMSGSLAPVRGLGGQPRDSGRRRTSPPSETATPLDRPVQPGTTSSSAAIMCRRYPRPSAPRSSQHAFFSRLPCALLAFVPILDAGFNPPRRGRDSCLRSCSSPRAP